MTKLFRVASVVAVPLLLASVAVAADTGTPEETAFRPCRDCHDTVAADFLSNPHRRAVAPADSAAAEQVCASCHGDGAKHAAEGDAALISVPRESKGAQTCLSCHARKEDLAGAASGAHVGASVYCGECHSIHAAPAGAARLLRASEDELCASCHPAPAAQHRKPYAHRLDRDAMSCVSCHNPHGGSGGRSLKQTLAGEQPCLACHTEKRGPFVFEHVGGLRGDCMSCHEPHGSNNPKRLIRPRVDRLCLECHTTLPKANLGSQPPSFHDLRSPRYANCTTCHAAIHGSNVSPLLLK
ncbi:MAG: DmsE family decaheme c-type cytochrome [Acidobacteriota bacterium]